MMSTNESNYGTKNKNQFRMQLLYIVNVGLLCQSGLAVLKYRSPHAGSVQLALLTVATLFFNHRKDYKTDNDAHCVQALCLVINR
jgi:hypothetical protein